MGIVRHRRRGRKLPSVNFVRPIRGLPRSPLDTHGFTVGYYRSSLHDLPFKKCFVSGGGLCLMRLAVQKDMSHHVLFRINQPQVISQTIDGEVVVIHLLTGTYYSLAGAAACLWNALERGAATAQMPELLESRFTECDAELEKIVTDFLGELSAESLIVPAEKNNATPVAPNTSVRQEKFARPALKKFTDMQELLLLDPIHEVDATGWPLAKPNPPRDAAE